MAKSMLQGSRIKGVAWRAEARADGGARYLRHRNRRAEEALWIAEANDDLLDRAEADTPCCRLVGRSSRPSRRGSRK